MKKYYSSMLLTSLTLPLFAAEFHEPVALKANGKLISTGSPGYAAPCWVDLDKDGKKDLLVGQYTRGKIKFYKGLEGGKLASGTWLKSNGKTAYIPGVW